MNRLQQLILETFTHPRETATTLTSVRFDRETLWTATFVVILLTGILQYLLVATAPPPVIEDNTPPETLQLLAVFYGLISTPFIATISLGCLTIASIFLTYFAGRMLGGQGHFPETMVIIVWLSFAAIPFAVLTLLLRPISFGVASMINLFAGIGLFYAKLHFIDVLHKFDSLWAAFGTVVIGFIGVLIGLAFLAAFVGAAALQTGAI